MLYFSSVSRCLHRSRSRYTRARFLDCYSRGICCQRSFSFRSLRSSGIPGRHRFLITHPQLFPAEWAFSNRQVRPTPLETKANELPSAQIGPAGCGGRIEAETRWSLGRRPSSSERSERTLSRRRPANRWGQASQRQRDLSGRGWGAKVRISQVDQRISVHSKLHSASGMCRVRSSPAQTDRALAEPGAARPVRETPNSSCCRIYRRTLLSILRRTSSRACCNAASKS